jgi:hypothetical protein
MSAALQSQDKELGAIQNLGLMSAQWRTQQQQQLAGAQQMMGKKQDEVWDYNVAQPWNIKANMAANKMGVGQQNLFAGMQDMGTAFQNYAGTNSLLNMYKSMNQQNMGGGGFSSGSPQYTADNQSA